MERGGQTCWYEPCDRGGRVGRVTYTERGGEIPLTLCDEHAREVSAALGDYRLRWGVLVTSDEPSKVIVEEPVRANTGRYRATFVTYADRWPEVILRRSLQSMKGRTYIAKGMPPHADVDIGVKYTVLEVSPEVDTVQIKRHRDWFEHIPIGTEEWPRTLLVERQLAGYTDRVRYSALDDGTLER
jgi:hypothetical protein